MRAGSVPYLIQVEGDEKAVPDLSHLERELGKAGFSCEPCLGVLQKGKKSFSQIFPSRWRASFVDKISSGFRLVVYWEDVKLDEFAIAYQSISLQQHP